MAISKKNLIHQSEFACWDSYSQFADYVRKTSRYILSKEQNVFLDTVLATIKGRDSELKEGSIFYRAQLGIDICDRTDNDGNWIGEDMLGFRASRMKPLADRAKEGRANPSGIPVLYVGTTVKTAISEVRPWVGANVSLATCKLLSPLRVLDLSLGHGKSSLSGPIFSYILGGKEPTAQQKEKAVWTDIDNAFSTPVTRSDDKADYAPTQILAELFRSAGYDAIAYKSHFGDEGYNIAIFDLDSVDVVSCAPYQVKTINIIAEQVKNAWYKTST